MGVAGSGSGSCEESATPVPLLLLQPTGCPLTLTFHAFRQRLLLLAPPRGGESAAHPAASPGAPPLRFDVTHTLAGVYGADVLVLVVDVSAGVDAAVDAEGDLALTCIRAVGVPTVVAVVQGLGGLPAPKAADARRWVGGCMGGRQASVLRAPP